MPFPWEKEKKDDNKDKDKLPESLENRFKTIDEKMVTKDDLTALNKKLEGLDSINAFVTEQKKEKEDRQRAIDDKKRADARPSGEDLAARVLSGDVESVVRELTEPQANLVLSVRADNIRREVFEDRAADFPYYTGDIKAEVDKIIKTQPLAFQNNPQALENTYYTVV